MLEAGTIVGPSAEKLRVDKAALEKELSRNTTFSYASSIS
jgi:hypothetical protein